MVCAGAARDIIMVGVGADLGHHDRLYRIFDMTMDGAGEACYMSMISAAAA